MPRFLSFSLYSVWDSRLGPLRSWERINFNERRPLGVEVVAPQQVKTSFQLHILPHHFVEFFHLVELMLHLVWLHQHSLELLLHLHFVHLHSIELFLHLHFVVQLLFL